MSNEEVLHSHYAIVRFDESAGSIVNWSVEVDDFAILVADQCYETLAEAGAPIAIIGILALRDLLVDQVIQIALERADNVRWRERFKQTTEREDFMALEKADLQLVH